MDNTDEEPEMSSQVESETYSVKCECGQTGSIEWVENDGYAAMRSGLETTYIASPEFEWAGVRTSIFNPAYYQEDYRRRDNPDWRMLLRCKRCGAQPRSVNQVDRLAQE
jgi:hypothetical protein